LLTGIEKVRDNIKHLKALFKALKNTTKTDLNKIGARVEDLVEEIYSLSAANMEQTEI